MVYTIPLNTNKAAAETPATPESGLSLNMIGSSTAVGDIW